MACSPAGAQVWVVWGVQCGGQGFGGMVAKGKALSMQNSKSGGDFNALFSNMSSEASVLPCRF